MSLVNVPALARMIARNIRYRPMSRLIHYARPSRGLLPKKISFPSRVMPRAFRRGYGLGGLLRRRPKRRFGRRVYRKKTQNKVHSFIRWCDKDTQYPGATGPSLITETGSVQHLAYTFKLDNVVNPSDFTNLYDSYKINKITLFIEPQWDQTGSVANGNPINRRIRVVHDYNDADPLTDEDQYLEYSNCKSYSAVRNKTIAITLYPKLNNVIENVLGTPNAYTSMSSSKAWLNMADDEVPHFGLKIMIPSITSEGVQVFRVRAKYHLSMKNSK